MTWDSTQQESSNGFGLELINKYTSRAVSLGTPCTVDTNIFNPLLCYYPYLLYQDGVYNRWLYRCLLKDRG